MEECATGDMPHPYHADDGARAHVLDETGEERLLGEIGVVLLQQLAGRCGHLQSDQLEALLFEALDDLADQTALNAVRPEKCTPAQLSTSRIPSLRSHGPSRSLWIPHILDHNVGAFGRHVGGWKLITSKTVLRGQSSSTYMFVLGTNVLQYNM